MDVVYLVEVQNGLWIVVYDTNYDEYYLVADAENIEEAFGYVDMLESVWGEFSKIHLVTW